MKPESVSTKVKWTVWVGSAAWVGSFSWIADERNVR